ATWYRVPGSSRIALTPPVALSEGEAVIEKPNGSRLTFRRHTMAPNEASLVCELGPAAFSEAQ
ncbi:MAG: hypothetical protein V3R30_09300, partial [Kiloniellales bacterium]